MFVFFGVYLAPTVKELWKSDMIDQNQSCQNVRKTPLLGNSPPAVGCAPGKKRLSPTMVGAERVREVVAEGVPLLDEGHEDWVVEGNKVRPESVRTVRLADGIREGLGLLNLAIQLIVTEELVVRDVGWEVGCC